MLRAQNGRRTNIEECVSFPSVSKVVQMPLPSHDYTSSLEDNNSRRSCRTPLCILIIRVSSGGKNLRWTPFVWTCRDEKNTESIAEQIITSSNRPDFHFTNFTDLERENRVVPTALKGLLEASVQTYSKEAGGVLPA